MKRKYVLSLVAVMLSVCLLLSGCSLPFLLLSLRHSAKESDTTAAATTEATEEAAYTEQPDWSLVQPRQQNAGGRDYLPDGDIAMLRFEDIEYVRPDVDVLCDDFAQLTQAVEDGETAEAALPVFFDVYDAYYDFYTMDSLANIRYYADMSNEYYKTEYEYCEQASPDVSEKFEAFLVACANSDEKANFESQCFGENYLDAYVDYAVYTNPDYLALAKQEKAVMENYHKAMEDPQIMFNGKLQSFDALIAKYEKNYQVYLQVLELYYNTYNPILGKYFIELINIRRQMAQVLGYDSYAELCYDQTYERDYTWEDGKRYIADIRNEIVPLYSELDDSGMLYSLQSGKADEALVRSSLQSVVQKLGGIPEEAYSFMVAYDLFDISASSKKMDTSFTTYLYSYEAPYILVNATGTTDDIFTFAHEFGHFTDSYYNYQAEEDLETAETFSQGMEWLALCNLSGVLSKKTLENTRIQKLADTVSVFISQAAYSDFEDRVYALSEDELTVEKLNSIYRQIAKDYGFYVPGVDFYYSQAWIDIPHFFEAPYYMISYCVSADTALQIYQSELVQPGSGLELYNQLLNRTHGAGLQAVVEEAGMEDPFKAGRIKEIAEFLSNGLDLD